MFGATDIVCVGCVVARVGNAEILGAPTHVCPQGLEMKFLNILQKFRLRKNRVSISDSCESKFRSVVSLLCVQFSGQCVWGGACVTFVRISAELSVCGKP